MKFSVSSVLSVAVAFAASAVSAAPAREYSDNIDTTSNLYSANPGGKLSALPTPSETPLTSDNYSETPVYTAVPPVEYSDTPVSSDTDVSGDYSESADQPYIDNSPTTDDYQSEPEANYSDNGNEETSSAVYVVAY